MLDVDFIPRVEKNRSKLHFWDNVSDVLDRESKVNHKFTKSEIYHKPKPHCSVVITLKRDTDNSLQLMFNTKTVYMCIYLVGSRIVVTFPKSTRHLVN